MQAAKGSAHTLLGPKENVERRKEETEPKSDFEWIQDIENELFVMTSRDGDGAGAAQMLCPSLMKTLGLTKEHLRNKLEHLPYDGVYEQSLNRKRGGSSLNLNYHVADYLDLGNCYWGVGPGK